MSIKRSFSLINLNRGQKGVTVELMPYGGGEMDFKLKELQMILFERKGWKPILLSVIFQSVLSVMVFLPLAMLLIYEAYKSDDFQNLFFGFAALFGLLFILPLGVFIQAGLYGSLKDSIFGKAVTFKDYLGNGKTHFWKMFRYSIIYGVVSIFIVFIVGLISSWGLPFQFPIIVTSIFLAVLASPVMYLCVFEGDTFSNVKHLYKKSGKEYIIIGMISWFSLFIPLVNILGSVFVTVFGLYAMVLFCDFEEELAEGSYHNEMNDLAMKEEEE